MSAARLAPAARRDLLAATRWIARDNPQAARALRDAVARALTQLGEHPYSGMARPELAGPPVRFILLRGFPYLVVYDADSAPPLVLRVLHGARDLPEVLRSSAR
jgi:toxin ParE1/3/4